MRYALLCAIALLAITASTFAQVVFDFEDGTMNGWTSVSGNLTMKPFDSSPDRDGSAFNKQGRYFYGGFEYGGDAPKGVLRSPDFTISQKTISLLVGGGDNIDREYIALCRASDGKVLFKETGRNTEAMDRRYWDVSEMKGLSVYIRIVDDSSEGWGHINLDDVRQMTPADEKARADEARVAVEAKQKWIKSLFAPTQRKVYTGKELTGITFQMGGIGAGNIALCGDGSLKQWQLFNHANSGCVVPYGFFAIRAQAGTKPPVTKILQTDPIDKLPTVAATEFIGEFPIAQVTYKDPALPVQVSLEAFSPFIPMKPRESGVPGITFTFSVKNPGKEPVSVSILGSLQNAVNYDGYTAIQGVSYAGYGGNVNQVTKGSGYTAVHMTNPTLDPAAKSFGSMTLCAQSTAAITIPQYEATTEWWDEFAHTGKLPAGPEGPSTAGKTWNGALAVPITVAPGKTAKVTFFITWSFPNDYADYARQLEKYRIGHMYNNWFADSLKAAEYLNTNFTKLAAETKLYRDTLYDSTLPYWMIDRISSQASTLTSSTTLWLEDGTIAGFEGCDCCPMNCTHVYDYEMTTAHLYPELERNWRDTDLTVQQLPNGGIRHRTELPLNAPRAHDPFVDGQLGTILKSYREYQRSPNNDWLNLRWPNIKKAMDFVIRDWDPNADGIIMLCQWNTYDAGMYGPNTFIGALYLAALRASEEMAKIQGDTAAAQGYRKIYEIGRKRLDEVLWNGEYWINIYKKDPALAAKGAWLLEDWPPDSENNIANPYGTGCHMDQLLGQWWADLTGLGYVLPQERVKTALKSIMKYNWCDDFGKFSQTPRAFAGAGDRGLIICTWPKGGRPSPFTPYSDEVWTGLEYEVAALYLWEGMLTEGFATTKAVTDRYNGVARPPIPRSPWNDIECGEHYARGMSSWSILLAAQGAFYNGPQQTIGFAPRVHPENHKTFFTASEGWGTFTQKRAGKTQTDTLKLAFGKADLKTLKLVIPTAASKLKVVVTLDGKKIPATAKLTAAAVTITLTKPASMKQGSVLTTTLSW